MSLSIRGKTAIVTGAGKGIGRAVARQLLARGANVMFADNDEAALQAELGHANDLEGQARSFVADMSQRLSTANLLSATLDAFDRVDMLVNAHRLVLSCDPLAADQTVLNTMLQENLMAGLRLSQIVARRMIQQAESEQDRAAQIGAIVNLTTLAAQRPQPQLLSYSIACAAQDQATRALALALAPHRIRVNSVAFGSVMSNELKETLKDKPDLRDSILAGTPMARIGSVEELTETVLYLVSDASSFVTGQIITVDGGRSLVDPVRAPMY